MENLRFNIPAINPNAHNDCDETRCHADSDFNRNYSENFRREISKFSSSSKHITFANNKAQLYTKHEFMETLSEEQQHRKRHSLTMLIQTRTWMSDLHGLFDYENHNNITSDLKCRCAQESYQICRINSEIRLLSTQESYDLCANNSRVEVLLELNWYNGSYYICAPTIKDKSKDSPSLWLAVRFLRDRTVALQEGDVLKLGRFRLKIKKIVASAQNLKSSKFSFRDNCEDFDDDCETAVPPESGDFINDLNYENYQKFANVNSLHQNGEKDANRISQRPDNVRTVLKNNSLNTFDANDDSTTPNVVSENVLENVQHEDNKQAKVIRRTKSSIACERADILLNEKTQIICRICLCEAANTEAFLSRDETKPTQIDASCFRPSAIIDDQQLLAMNPFIAPCECKGSLKWVHLYCLRTWITGRLNIKENSVSFFWKQLDCELCKTTYPSVVDIPSNKFYIPSSFFKYSQQNDNQSDQEVISESMIAVQKIDLFEISRPKIPYILLGMMESSTKQIKGFYVVTLADKYAVNIGRGHDVDVRISDISVSRSHAILRYQCPIIMRKLINYLYFVTSTGYHSLKSQNNTAGYFLIEDHYSKFGTLLELRQPFRLEPNQSPIAIQINRTVIVISLKRRWKFRFPGCIR